MRFLEVALCLLTASAAAAQFSLDQCRPETIACKAPSESTCCLPTNGNLVLAVQFLPGYCKAVKGACSHEVMDAIPKGQWTLHGLWPNTCDNYQIFDCDRKRMYKDTRDRIVYSPILQNMTRFWVTFKGSEVSHFNDFWSHEFGKHGTCYSPSNPECVGSSKGADVERFFTDALYLRSKYDVFNALKAASIVPSKTAAYKSADIVTALLNAFGQLSVALICKGPYLTEIRLALVGSGAGIAKNADFYLPGTCPRYGIVYTEEHSEPTVLNIGNGSENEI